MRDLFLPVGAIMPLPQRSDKRQFLGWPRPDFTKPLTKETEMPIENRISAIFAMLTDDERSAVLDVLSAAVNADASERANLLAGLRQAASHRGSVATEAH